MSIPNTISFSSYLNCSCQYKIKKNNNNFIPVPCIAFETRYEKSSKFLAIVFQVDYFVNRKHYKMWLIHNRFNFKLNYLLLFV